MPDNSILDRKNRELDAPRALTNLPPAMAPGALVSARGARWRVSRTVAHADCHELHLRGTVGETRTLLWPCDRPTVVEIRRRLREVSARRWVRRARALASVNLAPDTPRAGFRGDVLAYQLEPAIAMAAGAARVLLADEVGLGKTIQAGWILGDLLQREPDARVLVAVPASLRDQWASELETLFGVTAAGVDAAWLRAAVSDRAADVSPWAAPGVYLASIDFLKRPDVSASLTDVVWDLLVSDEAHTAAAPTERHATLARVAAVARRIVLISATPYSGDAAAFSSVVALGGSANDPGPLLFRRSRRDVGDARARRHRFALVRITAEEARLQRLLERYTREVWTHAPAAVESARLAMTVLRKRALSSPAAAVRSLTRRLELLRGSAIAARQLPLFGDELEADDELPETALATPGLADADDEKRRLVALIEAAGRAMVSDSKLRYLRRLVSRAPHEPVIVFTEYRDTLRRLADAFPLALRLHGGLSATERTSVQRQFNSAGGMLLATDAAADGLNLQRRCRLVVNYELPWNPARLEQRIGRVDRIGQQRRVHAISLVARDTAEDLVVAAVTRRLTRVSATLGAQDRLASFLTDAQVARSVIGGEGSLPVDDDVPVPRLPRPTTEGLRAEEVSAQLCTGRTPPPSAEVPVARARSKSVADGAVVIVLVALVNDGGCVAERAFAVRVGAARLMSSGSDEAMPVASRACAAAELAAPLLPAVRQWLDDVTRAHRTSIERRLAREHVLRGVAPARSALQPGLFDRRALDDRRHHDIVAASRDAAHAAHVGRLTSALETRIDCSAAAVVVSWR